MRGTRAKKLRREAYGDAKNTGSKDRAYKTVDAWHVIRTQTRWVPDKDTGQPLAKTVPYMATVVKADRFRQAYQCLKTAWVSRGA